MEQVDVFIAGAGIAGLTLAAALNQTELRICIADPKPMAPDPRTTAYLTPACALFREIGLWDALKQNATPLSALRIVNTVGTPPTIHQSRIFLPKDLGAQHFGWNIANDTMRQVLIAHLQKQPDVQLIFGDGFASMLTRTTEARVRLSSGAQIRSQLVVGADGRDSPVRRAAKIAVQKHSYGQTALAFRARHALAHENMSTEIYNQGGAFTTVPMPDHDGHPSSAIVWMNGTATAQELLALPHEDFDQCMSERAADLLGPMQSASPIARFPVLTQRAQSLISERCVLIAEAAHVLPPIGAQGLNTSLADVATLLSLAQKDGKSLGAPDTLNRYAQARSRDTAVRTHAIDFFNRVCKSGDPLIQSLRGTGLSAVHDFMPLRKALMKAGIGHL